MRNVSTMPARKPARCAALDRLQRPVHREARGHEDRRVHPGDEDGEARYGCGRPECHVRASPRVDDADEEVRGEERAEEHDLRADEEQHPERPRVDARALIRGRRPVVLVVVPCSGSACALTRTPPRAPRRRRAGRADRSARGAGRRGHAAASPSARPGTWRR